MVEVIKAKLNKKLRKIFKPKGSKLRFRRILLEDSTVVSLPETMKKFFKGCGGAASEAAVKFNFIIDQNSQLVVQMKLVGGSTPDASLSGDVLQIIEKEDLIIRDLGYFNLSVLSKIISMRFRYYLSRLSKTVYVYLSKDCETPIDLIDYLNEKGIEKGGIDIEVFIGKTERLPVRLIAIKVPDEVKEVRRARYKAKNKKEPADDLLEWNGYNLMITNISKEKLLLNSLLIIYKVRWKIELFFKNMKSHLCVDRLTGHNKYRMLCLIYIKATITLITTLLYSYAQLINRGEKEVSLFKFTKWLKDEGRLMRAFITGEYVTLLVELENNINYLCMQNRKKGKSVWEEARKALKSPEDIKKKACKVAERTEDIKKIA
jgi:Transposase DDE domain